MAFVLLSRSRSKPQGSVKPVPKRKSARGQHSADSRFGFAKPVFQPPTTALPTTAPVIQTKLKVGEPNDKFEQEADRVAELTENGNGSISPSTAAQNRSPAGSLQRLYGNQPVLQMRSGSGGPPAPPVPLRPSQSGILQCKYACGGAAGMSGECEECSKQKRFGLQTKLKVSEPGDFYEQEADRIADQVMATPAHPAVSGTPPRIQRFSGQSNGQMDTAPASVDQALASPGRPLEPALRQDMEQRFGHDFSQVRVHSGAAAEQSAREVNAHAYTVGHDMVFGAGGFAPGTQEGRRLTAHELTHVVQQGSGTGKGVIQRKPDPKDIAFEDCTEATTTIARPQGELAQALKRAQDMVDAALVALEKDPAGENPTRYYPVALERHFLNPTPLQRKRIRNNFRSFLAHLKPELVRCAAADKDQEYCASSPEGGRMAAFMRGGESFLCFSFWVLNRNCKAVTLIHEAAHAAGFGMTAKHPPYRGSAEYPFGAGKPGKDETTAIRTDNPDAYAFFAAHVWREIDSECRSLAEIIQIKSSPPSSKPGGESQGGK